MKCAKNQSWLNPDRLAAELQTDGSVIFAEDITDAELRQVVQNLFQELELRRLRALYKMAYYGEVEKRWEMWKDILETYRCLTKCRKSLPGMPLEDAFPELKPLEKEYEWLKQQIENLEEKKND